MRHPRTTKEILLTALLAGLGACGGSTPAAVRPDPRPTQPAKSGPAACPDPKPSAARTIGEARLLQRLAAQESNADERRRLLERLALRYLDLADAARGRREAIQACQARGASAPGQDPQTASAERDLSMWLTKAGQVYLTLLAQEPPPPNRDEHLFMLSTILFERKQEKQALTAIAQLIKQYPHSAYVPDAYLAFGEHFFARAQIDKALQAYEKVRAFGDSPVRGYATYKAAWCHYNQGDHKAALELFGEIVRAGQAGPGQALAREALRDYVRTFAHIGTADQAIATLSRLAPDQLQASLDLLESIWRDTDRADQAAALRDRRSLRPRDQEDRP